MQFFKPENYFEVRDALRSANRSELIGDGCDCLIPSKPPREAIERRREDANKRFRGEYVHTIPNDGNNPTDNAPQGGNSNGGSSRPNPANNRKGPRKQQRDPSSEGGKKPGTGYRPGRRV
jgi:hypothetical protein